MDQGNLLIVGGAELPARLEIMKAFVALAGGRDKRYAILPAATGDPLGGLAKMQDWLGELGVDKSQVELLEVSKVLPGAERGAWSTAVLEKARAADAIWMLGGNQNTIVELLLAPDGASSPLLDLLRGKTLGGTSAGAAVMSDPMIGSGTSFGALAYPRASSIGDSEMTPGLFIGRGLGFFPEGLIDQHFDTRARLGRLLEACVVEDGARRMAFGIAEATGLVYRAGERRLEVVGRGHVYVIDPREAVRTLVQTTGGKRVRIKGGILHLLCAGDSLDLASASFSFGAKDKIAPGDVAFDSEGPIASGILSPYGDLASFAARLLLDNRESALFLDEETGQRYIKSYLIDEQEGKTLGWEIRLGRIEGKSSLWYGQNYSFASVRIDILPIEVKFETPG